MSTTNAHSVDSNASAAIPLVFEGIINCFETSTHTGSITQEEKRPKKWDRDGGFWRGATPAYWDVTLSPATDRNRAWRGIRISLTRCKDMESAVRLAMRMIPAESIVKNGDKFGEQFWLKRNELVHVW